MEIRRNAALLFCALAPLVCGQNAPPSPAAAPAPSAAPSPPWKSKVTQLVETGRYPFSDWTMEIILSALYAADGRWADLDQDETFAQSMVETSFRIVGLPQQPARYAINALCRTAQSALMAQRNGSFDDIERLPPFSRLAAANLTRLASAWRSDGHQGFKQEWAKVFAPGWEANRSKFEGRPKVEGGPGDSRENAIRVLGAATDGEGIATEYNYIAYLFGRSKKEWNRSKQSLTGPDPSGHRFDVLEINLTSGGQRTLFFDITDFLSKQDILGSKPTAPN